MQKRFEIKQQHKKPAIIIAVVAVCLLTAVVVVYSRQHSEAPQATTVDQGQADPAAALMPTTPIEKAQALALDGKYDQAQALLKTAADQSTDPKQKAELLCEQAILSLNAQKYQEALAYAQAAEAAAPTRASAELIAQAAEKLGNKQLAVTFYQKAIDRINPNSPMKEDDTADLQAAIKRVQGQ